MNKEIKIEVASEIKKVLSDEATDTVEKFTEFIESHLKSPWEMLTIARLRQIKEDFIHNIIPNKR